MNPTALLDWSLDIECPHCKKGIDLVQYDSVSGDYGIAKKIFTNNWQDLEGWKIECPNCEKEFELAGVEY